MDKINLRKEALSRRSSLSRKECCEKSRQIATSVIALSEFKKSNIILLYAPIRNEVETEQIFCEAKRQKKDIYYPRVCGKEMKFYLMDETTKVEMSAYGIQEPIPETTTVYEPKREDSVFVVMPGAVFDQEGNRIGYGGGYYDKYLSWLAMTVPQEQICKVAVAYECQIVETGVITKEAHDVKADYVITEERNESISN